MRHGTDEAFALVLPAVSTAATSAFLERFAASLPPGVHAAVVVDRAGRHLANAVQIPDDLTLVHLPPYSP